MNTAVGRLQSARALWLPRWELGFGKATFPKLILVLMVLASAFGVVYAKEKHRQLFSDLQMVHQTRDTLHEAWGKLLLEQAAWSTQARVQGIAANQYDMQLPRVEQTVQIHQ